jgi:hypothetical protein
MKNYLVFSHRKGTRYGQSQFDEVVFRQKEISGMNEEYRKFVLRKDQWYF